MNEAIRLDDVSMRFILQHEKARSFQDALINLVHQRSGNKEEFWALRNVTVQLSEGEVLGVIGSNGSGKSTLLKLITRILEPTKGRVNVRGTLSALIELGAGFHPDLTGRENVYLNGSILGISRRDMDRRLEEIVSFSELERFIDMPVKHYSSGMYARLGFSVSASVDPDILIVDEVLAVGDEAFQRKCLGKIHDFRRRGKTIIFVSHALDQMESLCSRVIWLDQGVIRCDDNPTRAIEAYREAQRSRDRSVQERSDIENRGRASEKQHSDLTAFGAAVTDLGILGSDERERYTFDEYETVHVRVEYVVEDSPDEHEITIELRRNDGLLVHASSAPLPKSGMRSNPTGKCEITFNQLLLRAGTYELKASILPAGGGSKPEGVSGLRRQFTVWGDESRGDLVDLRPVWKVSAALDRIPTGAAQS